MKKILITLLIFSFISVPQVFGINENKIQTTAIEDIKVKNGAVLGLDDCIAIALNNNPSIKNARYNYGISRAQVGLARSEFFPTIGVGTGYDYTKIHAKRFNYDTNVYNINAQLNQLLFNFGKTNARIKMEKFYLIADEYNFYNTVRETIFNVKQKYYEVLASRASVLINRAYVDINERNYQRTKAYYDEGLKSKIDLVNAEVNLSDSKIGLIQSQNAYENSLVNLNNAMYIADSPSYHIEGEGFNLEDNVAPVDLSKISKKTSEQSVNLPKDISDATLVSAVEKLEMLTDYNVEKFPYSFDECIEMAYKNRADLKAYNSTLDAVKENLVYVKRNYYPEISANAGYGFRNTDSTNSFNVGVNLSSSLNIMAQKNQVDSAKYQVEIAQNSVNQLTQDIYFQVQNAYINMIELEKQIPLQGVKVRQTLENYELAEGRYYVGLSDYIELQNAKVNYNNAQNAYIETIYKYNVARAGLESVISYPQRVTVSLEDKKNGRKK
ncbi:TolC family protein [bacterium]|nr:TolC family protein [bacterium]